MVKTTLGASAPEWDALVDGLAVPSPFLRSWWLHATAAAEPEFVLVRNGGRLIGGVALQADRTCGVRRLRMMGDGPLCPDHLDLLADASNGRPDGAATRDAVVAALRQWFKAQGPLVVQLRGLTGAARLRRVFGPRASCVEMEPAPWLALSRDWPTFLAGRPSQLRNSLRQGARRMREGGAVYRATPDVPTAAALASLRELHAGQWGRRSTFLPVYDVFARAAESGVARGELIVHELAVGAQVIASQAWFEVDGRTSLYQGGRLTDDPKWRGSGGVLTAMILERACERGFSEADFLRGIEAYKQDWTSAQRPLIELRFAQGRAGRAALAALDAGDRLHQTAARVRRSRPVRAIVRATVRRPPGWGQV